MSEMEEMEELFERVPWLEKQFEIEQEIIEQLVMTESEYLKVLRKIEWAEHLDWKVKNLEIKKNLSFQI